MKLKIIYILLALTFILTSAVARPCSTYEYDKAEYFSEKAAHKIVDEYGGGSDIRMTLRSCSYNSFSEKFKTKIEVYWNGSMIRSNKYNVDGELKFTSDGTLLNFSKTYENEAIKELKFLVGGVIVFAAIASEGN